MTCLSAYVAAYEWNLEKSGILSRWSSKLDLSAKWLKWLNISQTSTLNQQNGYTQFEVAFLTRVTLKVVIH